MCTLSEAEKMFIIVTDMWGCCNRGSNDIFYLCSREDGGLKKDKFVPKRTALDKDMAIGQVYHVFEGTTG